MGGKQLWVIGRLEGGGGGGEAVFRFERESLLSRNAATHVPLLKKYYRTRTRAAVGVLLQYHTHRTTS